MRDVSIPDVLLAARGTELALVGPAALVYEIDALGPIALQVVGLQVASLRVRSLVVSWLRIIEPA